MSTCGVERGAPGARLARLLTLPALFCMAAAAAAPAPTVIKHKVQRGDSLSALAIRHYGTKDGTERLARVNGLESGRALQIGQTLRIPLSLRHKIRAGDTASRLAEKYLGGASRHALLLEMNGLQAGALLAAGTEIEVPALVEHIMQHGETLGVVAKRYYGDAARASWLAAANGVKQPDAVLRGSRLQVPVVGFLPAAAAPPPRTETASAARNPPADRAATGGAKKPAPAAAPAATAAAAKPPAEKSAPADPAIERAVQLYREGEYRKAGDLLGAALEAGALPPAERARALRYRAFCAVALGDRDGARRQFQELHQQAPEWRPDPLHDSPKIRQIFSEAVGAPVTASKSPS